MAAPSTIANRMRFWCQSFAYIGRNSDKAKADFQEAAEKLELVEQALDRAEKALEWYLDSPNAREAVITIREAQRALLEKKS